MNSCYIGDVRDGLRHWIAQGVRAQTCVTSPPYWGLHDYGTAQWQGGDATCAHVGSVSRTVSGGVGKQYTNTGSNRVYSGDCDCGARRVDSQIGLEPTIAEYVATMVDVFRLVREVLADDGTLWLNLGDSYAAQGGGKVAGIYEDKRADGATWQAPRHPSDGLKAKDLCGIPWRVAFALQADGWYLRSDIIWAKPNPMPESVTDRPTKAHEYLFLLSKQELYYYDAAAIAEPALPSSLERYAYAGEDTRINKAGRYREEFDAGSPYIGPPTVPDNPTTRNRRSVWTITTQPYTDAHFAVMPTALVEPCIAAGSHVGDVVLDPFMGSGTVAQVAQDLGRRWIGCELSPDYAKMIDKRTSQQAMALAAD